MVKLLLGQDCNILTFILNNHKKHGGVMKKKLFKPIYWIMLILLSIDFIDTNIRIISGHLSGQGINFPGFLVNIQLSSIDFTIFIIAQLVLAYCIYQLFNLKKIGGYIFMLTNIIFLIYGFVFGPFSTIPANQFLPLIILYFSIYIVFVIGIPYYYSDKFK